MNTTASLLRDLVRLPSVNPMGRELPEDLILEHRVTAYLEDYFKRLGVPCERQPVAPGRDNIVARTTLANAPATIVFEAHQDTVPIDNMTIAPFEGKIEGNRLYGRGACDIKGGMTAMLTAFARLVRDKPAGACNVIMACTVDEEHTFTGVTELVQRGLKADAAVVAEPTDLNIVHAHKGVTRWQLTTTGRSCHSSSPHKGINAVYRMADVLRALEEYARDLQARSVDPELGSATISVGRIEGGTSVNTVPDACRIEIDRRLIPGEEALSAQRDLVDFLKARLGKDVQFACDKPWMAKTALSSRGSAELTRRLGTAIDAVRGKHSVHAVPYGTDASGIAAAGIPAVVFGPGDIGKAHTCDEWVPLDEVDAAAEILYRFACEYGR
jgi:acetylornithine deacetylase